MLITGLINVTESLQLRNLDINKDNLSQYLDWLRNTSANPFIEGVDENYSMKKLMAYINDRNLSETALLLAIMDKSRNSHIGNIKLEPLVLGKEACIGILIGDQKYRGVGVGYQVISSVMQYAKVNYDIKYFYLGVNPNNIAAINLYKKLDFKVDEKSPHISSGIEMCFRF